MLNSFTYTGTGTWGPWETLSAFSRRVEIEVTASFTGQGDYQAYLYAQARVFENRRPQSILNFPYASDGRISFTFQAGFEDGLVPEMHGPAIRFRAARGAQIAVTWRETSWRPITPRLKAYGTTGKSSFNRFLKTGLK